MVRIITALILFVVSTSVLMGQETNEPGSFSGSLQTNANFFIKDSLIGASNTPQYEKQKYGGESWFQLNYVKGSLDMGIRFDIFHNSNIINPTGSFSGSGIGNWFIHKRFEKLDLTAGFIYDQIGSGIIYRAYEDRPLAIDNALYGIRVGYQVNPDWNIKAFAGKVKGQFTQFGPLMKGIQINGYVAGKEGSEFSIAPGMGIVNQTFDDETLNKVLASVSTYRPDQGVELWYNNYASTIFNTLTYKSFTLYTEAAYKYHDIYRDALAPLKLWNGGTSIGRFRDAPGSVLYGSLTWAAGKLGISLEGKRTENFRYRADPFATGNFAFLNFIPPMARQNSYRLTAFYSPVTQEISEQAFQAEVTYAINENAGILVNASHINTLEGDPLYREVYTELTLKNPEKWNLVTGIQYQQYNIDVYLTKPGDPDVHTIVPYFDFLYKLDARKSLRFEGQFMATQQDRGNWAFGLVEFGIAPKWFFTVSDMFNLASDKIKEKKPALKNIGHFISGGVVYSHQANRFSLNYVKQVDGIVCSGGVCRYEPAFNGVRFNLFSNF